MAKPVIFCVEDEESILDGLQRILIKNFESAYTIGVSEDGKKAIDIIEEMVRNELDIALIISDYFMPGMKGDEVLIKTHQIVPNALKILLTGGASLEGITNIINKARLYRYISKPWQSEDLVLTIKEALRSYHQTKLLEEQNNRLRELLESLEIRVEERTAKLSIANKKLKEARRRAEMSNQAKSVFLANISHEIKTPLNAIIGFSDLLFTQLKESQFKNYLQSIKSSSNTLLNLINDILDLSKIEAGQLELHPKPLNLAFSVDEIKNIFSLKAMQKQIELNVEVSSDIPHLLLDELRLHQILNNLMSNALKFTEKGYIKIKVNFNYSPVDKNSGDVIISIQDTGIGIPATAQKAIFAPFKQQEEQDERRFGGTGLGLTISKRLIEFMNGEIFLKSEVNRGSIFTIVLKNVKVSKTIVYNKPNIAFEINNYIFEKATILVVDDNKMNRELLRNVLESINLNVTEARNGQEAVKMAMNKPDLILMDIRMPLMDGNEATRLIKNTKDCQNIPIIALTAATVSQDKNSEKQFDSYLRKPLHIPSLYDELLKYLKHHKITSEDKKETENKLSDSVRKKLPEIIHRLELEYVTKSKELLDAIDMETVGKFGKELNEFAISYNLSSLSNTAKSLIQSANEFDIERANALLMSIPDFAIMMKNHLVNTSQDL
ncbi:MAG: response regulator [Leptospiraceae bacterium]|nr:response regulator [Leptospiraceae bacterium]